MLLLLPNMLLSQPLNAPNLGESAKFALFTAVGAVTCAGTSAVTGNIGTNSGALTGFPPGTIQHGQAHVQDVFTLQAAADVIGAYTYLQNMSCTAVLGTTLGNNQILLPGIYCTGAASTLDGNLTFDAQGNPDALFVVQMDGAFATSTFSSISLINGASFCNVYWQVNGAFTLGDFSLFRGTIVTNGAITLLQGATILGRGLSKVGAIATSNVTATMPIPFIMHIKSNKDYLFTNESATFTTSIKCGCPTNNVVPVVTIPSGLTHQNGGIFSIDKVTFPSTTFAEGQTIDFGFQAMANNTVVMPVNLFYDDVEGAALFTASTLAGTMPTFSLNTLTPIFENQSWAVGDSLLPSDVALTVSNAIAIPAFGNYSLHFSHRFLSDTLDGGVVEFSINGGTSWTDAATLFTQNGYNDTLNFVTDNALINRQVFTRSSNGKRESIIDISSFVGQNLLFRFRFATGTGNGASGGLTGWNIDRIWLANSVACLPLVADATVNNISKITATMCQNVGAAASLGFELILPANVKSCTALVTYPPATTVNNEGLVSITYSNPSGTVFPLGTTTVVVDAIDAGGNTATSSFDVMVNDAIPSINNLAVNVSDTIFACKNTDVVLTAPTNADEYLWYRNGIPVNYQIAPNNTHTISGGNAGSANIYTLVVVYPGMLCISPQSSPVTIIRPNPSATISLNGLPSFCANTPTLLTAPAGMAEYRWKKGNIIVQLDTLASYLPTVSGNYNVTVMDMYGCEKTSAITSITVKAVPNSNAGADRDLCVGTTTQIGSGANTAYTYFWTPNADLSNALIGNPIANPLVNRKYTLFMTNLANGCTGKDSMNITILDLPPLPTTSVHNAGNNVIITANTPNAATINWYKNGAGLYANKLPNSAISVLNANPTNVYTVKSKGANGCLSLPSAAVNVRLNQDLNNENVAINIYPNPTQDIVNMVIDNNPYNEGKILLYNGLGQIIFSKNITSLDKTIHEEIDMSQLASGIYSLIFQSNEIQYIGKIVKE